MWRSQTLLSARRLFEHQVQRRPPVQRPSAATGRRDVAAHHLLKAAPPSCRARASAQPKKAQHDNHDDNHTNNPKDIVHLSSVLCEVVPLDQHIVDAFQLKLRPIIGQARPSGRTLQSRRSLGALTQISSRKDSRSGAVVLIVARRKYAENIRLKFPMKCLTALIQISCARSPEA
jgi:hypothetical protein